MVVNPENLPWWSVDELGQLEIVRYTEEIDNPDLQDGYPVLNETYTRHWWLTLEGWWYADDDQKGTDEALKNFPVQKWALKDEIAPTEAASLAQLMYYRKDSELHIVEVNSAFPQTWIPVTAGDEDPEETVKGGHIVAGWDPTEASGAKPMILETTGVSLTHLVEKRLPELEEAALSPYGRQREVGGNDSGVALAHIQETAKNVFRQHAKAGSQSEYRGLQPVAELLGEELSEDAKVAWPRKFGTLSDTSQAEMLVSFKEMQPGPLFEEHILREMAEVTLSDLTPDQMDEAIEAWQTDQEEQKQREQEQEDSMFGLEAELNRAKVDEMDRGPAAANPQQVQGGPQKER
jgi:hypothetical protein